MKQFSIIIVNYNSGNLLNECVNSIIQYWDTAKHDFEIVIYDNNSSDDSINRIQKNDRVKIIAGPENLGFAKANNLAANHSTGEWIFFLNPDTLLTADINIDLDILSKSLRDIVYVTPLMEKNKIVKSGFLVPTVSNYIKAILKMSTLEYWYLGASIIMHRSVYNKTGGWSNDFFMFAEDLDLSYRLNKMGIKIQMLDHPIHHVGGGTTRTAWNEYKRGLIVERSARLFYQKNRILFDYYALFLPTVLYKLFTGQKDLRIHIATFCKVNMGIALIKETNL